MTYRYKDDQLVDGALRRDDTWIYVPTLRRVDRFTKPHRSDEIEGTPFTMDDARGQNAPVPDFEWSCLGRRVLIAPVNGTAGGYPIHPSRPFGPAGVSFANDRWELRQAVGVRLVPKLPEHPYGSKVLWVDAQTWEPLYAFAYDRTGALWRVFTYALRFSEDDADHYAGWEGVPEPRDLRIVGEVVLDLRTNAAVRLEYWDAHGTPFSSRGCIRRVTGVSRWTCCCR